MPARSWITRASTWGDAASRRTATSTCQPGCRGSTRSAARTSGGSTTTRSTAPRPTAPGRCEPPRRPRREPASGSRPRPAARRHHPVRPLDDRRRRPRPRDPHPLTAPSGAPLRRPPFSRTDSAVVDPPAAVLPRALPAVPRPPVLMEDLVPARVAHLCRPVLSSVAECDTIPRRWKTTDPPPDGLPTGDQEVWGVRAQPCLAAGVLSRRSRILAALPRRSRR